MKLNKFFICFLLSIPAISIAQTNLIQIDAGKHLTYTPDNNGFIIPDFSYAGYHNGGVDLPDLTVKETITAISGDNTAHIQAAIDKVGALTPDAKGFRGAVLLKKGTYEVTGTLYVKYDGVVLRGEGNETSGTVIRATGDTPHQRDVIVLGNIKQNKWDANISNKQNITDNIVPVGAMSFSVVSASSYKKGDLIVICHPCTDTWLNAVEYGGVPTPSGTEADERWISGQLPIMYHRYVTAVSGNKISIDAPVFYTLNKSLSQSYIYKFNTTNSDYIIKKEIGLENLRVEITCASGAASDEDHAWQAVRFKSTENCWARNVVTKGFGQSGFITDCCTRSTIENCKAIDPISIITGERRYNFNTYVYSQLILFKDCYASNGRHHYISNGTSLASGNVFLNCISDAVNNANEGHRQWTQAMLYDNHRETNLIRDFVIGLYNRVDMGTGHGWAAVHSVLWNCDVSGSGVIGLQKPPTAQNYAIGCIARSITGKPVNDSNFPIGYVEKQNQKITAIPSLYEAQLYDRLNHSTTIRQTAIIVEPIVKKISEDKISLQFDESSNEKQISLYSMQGQQLCNAYTCDDYVEMSLPPVNGILLLCVNNTGTTHSFKISH